MKCNFNSPLVLFFMCWLVKSRATRNLMVLRERLTCLGLASTVFQDFPDLVLADIHCIVPLTLLLSFQFRLVREFQGAVKSKIFNNEIF